MKKKQLRNKSFDDTQNHIHRFKEEREQLNELVLQKGGLSIKRFLNLDHRVYEEGAIPAKYKELMGLVASLVLRCDDCIQYHLIQCKEQGISDAELEEALSTGLIVGGSITIPHLRRAFRDWEALNRE